MTANELIPTMSAPNIKQNVTWFIWALKEHNTKLKPPITDLRMDFSWLKLFGFMAFIMLQFWYSRHLAELPVALRILWVIPKVIQHIGEGVMVWLRTLTWLLWLGYCDSATVTRPLWLRTLTWLTQDFDLATVWQPCCTQFQLSAIFQDGRHRSHQ